MSSIAVTTDLARWLIMTGKGTAFSVSYSIPAGTTINQDSAGADVAPKGSDQWVLIDTIQFDGVQSGQVGYSLTIGKHVVSAYAVQSFPIEVGLISSGRLLYQIQSAQSGACVVNIDAISIPDDVYQEIVSALSPRGQVIVGKVY